MLAPGTSQGSSESVASTTPDEDEDEPPQIPNDSQVAPSIHHFNTVEDEQGNMVEAKREKTLEIVDQPVPPTPPVESKPKETLEVVEETVPVESKPKETPEVVEETVPVESKPKETPEVVEETVPVESKPKETPEVVEEPVPPTPPADLMELENTEETPAISSPLKDVRDRQCFKDHSPLFELEPLPALCEEHVKKHLPGLDPKNFEMVSKFVLQAWFTLHFSTTHRIHLLNHFFHLNDSNGDPKNDHRRKKGFISGPLDLLIKPSLLSNYFVWDSRNSRRQMQSACRETINQKVKEAAKPKAKATAKGKAKAKARPKKEDEKKEIWELNQN